jgi:hypothetical protein
MNTGRKVEEDEKLGEKASAKSAAKLPRHLLPGDPAHTSLPSLIAARRFSRDMQLTSFVGRFLAQKALPPRRHHEITLRQIPVGRRGPVGIAQHFSIPLNPLPGLKVRRKRNAAKNRSRTTKNEHNPHIAMVDKQRAAANSTDDLRPDVAIRGCRKRAQSVATTAHCRALGYPARG